jgi:hypothetical protein
MTKLRRAGESGAIDVAESQNVAKSQLAALVNIVRQLIGNPNIASGSSESTDPLTAPFHLYVDDNLGRDTYVTGDFNSFESTGTDEQKIAQKLKRIREQRLECGYTRAAPFKTPNRAVLEAHIITSLNWYTFTDVRAHRDCVIIHMGSGPQFIYNHPGSHSSAVAISAWADGKVPTWQELIAFNDDILGGLILPRGAAFDGEDLRKTVLIPMWAPAPADIASDYSNIRCVLYLTPDVHAVDFTFRDPIGQSQSLHLLYCLGYPSQSHLNSFYAKAFTALGSSANLSAALSQARASEYQTVGPFEGSPSPAYDTVKGSSPYPERISVRSEWGMGGLFINGDNLGGLKSTITAQFTGISLQKDVNSLQVYSGGSWITPSSLQAYIDTIPDNRRIKPQRAHCHLLVIRDAFCSEVSVFGLCHTARARADLGGEIVSSNGNFTFGSCAALATGYARTAVPLDTGWLINRISVPVNLSDKTPAIRRITLGTVASHSASNITLLQALSADTTGTTPQLLATDGYSLPGGTYVWVENPDGDDWRALLTSTAWAPGTPARINITAALSQSGTNADVPSSFGISNAIGKSVYIRRVVDNRTLAERSASLELTTYSSRTPNRSAILQTSAGVSGGGINRPLAPDGEEVLAVTSTSKTEFGARVTLRRSCPSTTYTVGTFYRKGVVVKAVNKHFKAIRNNYATASTPPLADWDEAYVHMPEAYNPEEPITNEAPQIVFNTDTDPNDITTSCGINWTTIFASSGPVRDQYRTGSDVLGLYALLRALGFSESATWTALTPRATATRRLNPASAADFPLPPSGGAASGLASWAVEFRRPTTITLSNFTYDQGAGHGNYSTALPKAQKPISASNLFSLYFTNGGGGRVVVNGVNENGQVVTNRGLTDTETGETVLAGDQAGTENSQQESFSNISVNGLTGSGVWNLSSLASLLFPSSSAGKTTSLGTFRLANAATLRSNNIPIGANDGELNASLDNSPEIVNLKGLNYWAKQKGVLTRKTGDTTLYVVPDSATAAGQSFVFNGTSAELILSPVRSAADVFAVPPLARETAVTFAIAVVYANATFDSTETVNYQLADGPYWNQLEPFNHIANWVGATNQFPVTNIVADYTAANTKPTTDAKALHDARSPFLVPCFAGGLAHDRGSYTSYDAGMNFFENSFFPEFRVGGSVNGVCWLSMDAVAENPEIFPSTLYPSDMRIPAYRPSGVTFRNFLDNYLDATISNGFVVQGPFTKGCVSVKSGIFTFRNVILGGKSPGPVNPNLPPSIVSCEGDIDVFCSGIYFLGNTRIDSLPKALLKGATFPLGIPGSRNCHSFVGSMSDGKQQKVSLTMATPYSFLPNSNVFALERNRDTNCIHILNNLGNYALVSDRASTGTVKGASMQSFIHTFNAGSVLSLKTFDNSFVIANKSAGMAGAFGNDGTSASGPLGITNQAGRTVVASGATGHPGLWRMATSGTMLASNVTLTYAPGGRQISYDLSSSNALNLVVNANYQGVDVNTATQHIGRIVGSPPAFFV